MEYKVSDITALTSDYNPGICKIFIIPINVLPTVETNNAGIFPWPEEFNPATFETHNIVELKIPKQYFSFSEKPKESKAGDFFEVKIGGRSNKLNAAQIQSLTALSTIPVQVLVFLSQNISRLFGETDRGLDFTFSTEHSNFPRLTDVTLQITGQSKLPAPITSLIM